MNQRKNAPVVVEVVIITMSKTKSLVYGAVIAAIYAALTLLLPWISYGPVQFRVSEVLTVLPIFMPCAIPGLTIGCVLANLIGGFGVYDVVFGSLATLLGAVGTRIFRKQPFFAMLSPVITNSLIVGSMLYFVVPNSGALLFNMLTVGFGELVICIGLGLPLVQFLKKHPTLFGNQ